MPKVELPKQVRHREFLYHVIYLCIFRGVNVERLWLGFFIEIVLCCRPIWL